MNTIEILKDIEYDIVKYKLGISELPTNKITEYSGQFSCFVEVDSEELKKYHSSAIKFSFDNTKIVAIIDLSDCPMDLSSYSDNVKLAALLSMSNQKVATNREIKEFLTRALNKNDC